MNTPENKKADTEYPINDALAARWSPRAFDDKMIPADTLNSIFEAARWTMSSYNEQPWRYIVATKENPEAYDKLLGCLDEFNQKWTPTAPVLMLGCTKTYFRDDVDKENKHTRHDLGAASAMLTIEALHHDVYVHQMAGIDYDKARETYDLPKGYEVVTALALGYIGDIEQLPEDLQKGETKVRTRKPIEEIFFDGKWGGE